MQKLLSSSSMSMLILSVFLQRNIYQAAIAKWFRPFITSWLYGRNHNAVYVLFIFKGNAHISCFPPEKLLAFIHQVDSATWVRHLITSWLLCRDQNPEFFFSSSLNGNVNFSCFSMKITLHHLLTKQPVQLELGIT